MEDILFRLIDSIYCCTAGYSLRCDQCFEHDDDNGEGMRDSGTQRGIYQSDRVHAGKFLER